MPITFRPRVGWSDAGPSLHLRQQFRLEAGVAQAATGSARLRDVVSSPGTKGRHGGARPFLRQRAGDDDGGPRLLPEQKRERGHAVHHRHLEIEQHHLRPSGGRERREGGDGLLAVPDAGHHADAGVGLEHTGEGGTHRRAVIAEHHPDRGGIHAA
jgi:hypothetical protein